MASAELFSKVSRRMWADEKFCSLSAPPPNARDLWMYLLTGPHNTAIPGVFQLGELALAEALDWDPEPTRACLQEILVKNMIRFDRKRRLFWLPNGLHHNLPRSPKQVLGWANSWRLLPECDLLREAASAMRAELATKSAKLAEAFDRVVGGLVEATDLDDEADDVPPSDRSVDPPVADESLPDRESGSYQIGTAVPTSIQEKEKEKREGSPSGGSRPGARSSRPAGRTVAGSEEARTVLNLLRMSPALVSVATEEFACRLADHCASGPHTGRLPLDDLLHAIGRAAEAEADQSAGVGQPRDQRAIAGFVMGYVRNQKVGEARKAAEREAARDTASAARFLAAFDAAWSKAHNGRVRAHAAGDEDHAAAMVALAERDATRAGPGVTTADVLEHWAREHLRSTEKFVSDADHPLRMLPGRVDSYGLPRPKTAKPAEEPRAPGPPPVDEAVAVKQHLAGAAALRGGLEGIGHAVIGDRRARQETAS